MNGRRSSNFAASPTIVGAVTVLVVLVAVFLAYNANQGLPFAPTYRVTAQVPNADAMVDGNDVRIAGIRVGVIESIEPVLTEDGELNANLELRLQRDLNPIPKDSVITIRNQSTIGLKYLELKLGESAEGFGEGDMIPASSARPEPVNLDDLFNVFDEPTREAVQTNLVEFGNALAGRGPQLNGGLAELRELVTTAQPVVRNLADPGTSFGPFWQALAATSAEVAPVAEVQAQLFVGLDATFGAFARTARPYLEETIEKGPGTLDASIESFPSLRPFLRHSETFFTEIQPGVDALADGADDYAAAFVAGVPALRNAPRLNTQLPPTAQTLVDFQGTPGVNEGLDLLAETNNFLDPPLRFITPSQTVCNYLALLFRNVANIGSSGDGRGHWTRAISPTPPTGLNNEGIPSAAPANGPVLPYDNQPDRLAANHLHYNPYPNTAAPGQTRECEAGREGYLVGRTVIGNVPGNQGITTVGQGKKKKKKKKGKR